MKNKNYFKKAALLFMVCSSQFIMAQVPNYVPTNGLVGYWPFNGNANDASGNVNNGTNNAATLTTDRLGNANSAYSFNGSSSYINIPNSSSLQFSGGITYSVWFNATNIPVGAVNSTSYLMSKGADGLATSWISFLDTAKISLGIYNNTAVYNEVTVPSSQLSFQTNQWYNATFTFDGTNARAYINGVLKSTVASTYTAFSNIYDLKFGRRHISGLPYFFNGKLDDIGIWNRALSAQEITNMYNQVAIYSDDCNAVSGSLTQGLVGYWPFCGNANDDSGHGNNGTVNGATLTTDRFGNANSAYSYNGTNSYIDVPNSASLQFNGGITISAWINPNTIPVSGASYILSKGADGGTPYSWTTFLDPTGKVGTSIYSNTNANSGGVSVSLIPTNQWTYVTFSFDGSQYKCYINGVLNYSAVSNYTTFSNIYDLKFGRRHISGLPYFFNGKLDDIGIWNRALTIQEVNQLYNQNQCFTNTTVTDTLVINVGQLGFNPATYANNITIYPNPASTQVNISFNTIADLNGGTIKIINALGQQVATTPITATGTNTTMTLSTWGGAGLYFVQIVNPQGQIVDIKKILLQ